MAREDGGNGYGRSCLKVNNAVDVSECPDLPKQRKTAPSTHNLPIKGSTGNKATDEPVALRQPFPLMRPRFCKRSTESWSKVILGGSGMARKIFSGCMPSSKDSARMMLGVPAYRFSGQVVLLDD